MRIRGWVYVITNRAMPGLVKVGFSTKDPTLRAIELANTGAPHRYEVLYDALVEQPRDVESAVHDVLGTEREGREWFRCSPDRAIAAIRKSAKNIITERGSSTVADAVPLPEMQLHARLCWYADCKATVSRLYHDQVYCAKHFEVERRDRFNAARRLQRDGY